MYIRHYANYVLLVHFASLQIQGSLGAASAFNIIISSDVLLLSSETELEAVSYSTHNTDVSSIYLSVLYSDFAHVTDHSGQIAISVNASTVTLKQDHISKSTLETSVPSANTTKVSLTSDIITSNGSTSITTSANLAVSSLSFKSTEFGSIETIMPTSDINMSGCTVLSSHSVSITSTETVYESTAALPTSLKSHGLTSSTSETSHTLESTLPSKILSTKTSLSSDDIIPSIHSAISTSPIISATKLTMSTNLPISSSITLVSEVTTSVSPLMTSTTALTTSPNLLYTTSTETLEHAREVKKDSHELSPGLKATIGIFVTAAIIGGVVASVGYYRIKRARGSSLNTSVHYNAWTFADDEAEAVTFSQKT